jgi:hypothetical protein
MLGNLIGVSLQQTSLIIINCGIYSQVEDAARALESTNGTALEKDGQLLRVAFAKSIGPSSTATPSQGSAAAAAAIEAAIFSQQVLILYF